MFWFPILLLGTHAHFYYFSLFEGTYGKLCVTLFINIKLYFCNHGSIVMQIKHPKKIKSIESSILILNSRKHILFVQ